MPTTLFIPNSRLTFVTEFPDWVCERTYYQMSLVTDATKVNRLLTEQKMERKHLFLENPCQSSMLNIKAQASGTLKGEISTHQFSPEKLNAAELITDSQSVSSAQSVSVIRGLPAP